MLKHPLDPIKRNSLPPTPLLWTCWYVSSDQQEENSRLSWGSHRFSAVAVSYSNTIGPSRPGIASHLCSSTQRRGPDQPKHLPSWPCEHLQQISNQVHPSHIEEQQRAATSFYLSLPPSFSGMGVSLYSPGCPGTHYRDPGWPWTRVPPAASSEKLESRVCITTPSLSHYLFISFLLLL